MDRSRSVADRSRPRERRARGGDPYRPSQRYRERVGLQVEHRTRGSSPPPESKYYARSRPVEPSGPPPDRRQPREPANPPSVETSSSPRRPPRLPHGPPPGVTETVSHRSLPRRVVAEEREEAEHEESEELEEGAGSAPSSGPPVADPPTRGGYSKRGCGFRILIREILPDLSIGGPLILLLKLCRVLLHRLSVLIARRRRERSTRVPQVVVKRRILSR